MPLASDLLDVRIWRGTEHGGAWATYPVPQRANQTVLDVVTYVQRELEPTLSYRFACRVGMCGSCAMAVNGIPRWTCRTHVHDAAGGEALAIAPLPNLPVVKDLCVDMDAFFEKWQRARGFYRSKRTRQDEFARIPPDDAARRLVDAGVECINCAVCYAACDVVARRPDYLGPAALNRAWTLINDERDADDTDRLRSVAGDAGCHACHSQQGCRERCPKHLNPSAAIAALKRATMWAALRGQL
ncbi:MAG: 2Fe-2S iron-sulfur cluster-binding protein [Gammaproteobacteria bacterium]|nr:2Fe-2S iron-sulfur cluster-binding protein [Gammaproteobacteria bacterium]